MVWHARFRARFRSFDAAPPAVSAVKAEKLAWKGATPYWQAFTSKPRTELLEVLERAEDAAVARDPAEWTDETALMCPASLLKSFRELWAAPTANEILLGAVDAQSRIARYLRDELGICQGSLRSDIRQVWRPDQLWRLLSNYCSVDMSAANLMIHENVLRVVALHLVRHLRCYNVPGMYEGETARKNQGWTRGRVLVLTTTRMQAKTWAEALRAIYQDELLQATASAKAKRSKRTRGDAQQESYMEFLSEYSELSPKEEEDEDASAGSEPEFMVDDVVHVIDKAKEIGLQMIHDVKQPKPLDYVDTFRGLNDDNFVLGVALNPGEMKYFCRDPSRANVIIASPLGLRVELEKFEKSLKSDEKEGSWLVPPGSWLSSLEILVVDRASELTQFNFEHLKAAMELANRAPTSKSTSCKVNVNRLRPSHFESDEDMSALFRQTIYLSAQKDALVSNGLAIALDRNYRGLARLWRTHDSRLAKEAIESFANNVMCMNANGNQGGLSELLKSHFIKSFYQHLAEDSQVVIVVPSYLEHLEVKHLLLKGYVANDEDELAEINEQLSTSDADRARQRFTDGRARIMLLSERYYFYRRVRMILKATNLIFYGSPKSPFAFAELVEQASKSSESAAPSLRQQHICIIYWHSKYEMDAMERLVGIRNVVRLSVASQNGKLVPLHNLLYD